MRLFTTIRVGVLCVLSGMAGQVIGQCSTTNATSCSCPPGGGTDCDLAPDVMISWQALQSYASGPSEYSQTSTSNAGRLRISGATPNIGLGPLEVRGVNASGYRTFICGSDTTSIYAPTVNTGFSCPNGFTPRQILYQRIYHKNGNTMSFSEQMRGSMTYHAGHGHYHVDGWTTMTLRLAQPGVSDPRDWPVLASGGKLGFCLTNLFTCSGSSGYCRDSNIYGQGNIITNSAFGSNYGLGVEYGCTDDAQSIVVGKGDIYSESLDGMWINLMPGLCNGQYYIVAEVDPDNNFIETNDANNWTYIPFTLTQQSPANSGGTANIFCDGPLIMGPGQTRTLTASPGTAYSWSTGATSRSITVSAAGSYSCTVTCPCGSLATPSLTLTSLAAPPAPTGTGATIYGSGTANLSATGSNVRWYDASSGGNLLGSGNNWTTPSVSSTTNFWAEDRNISPGVDLNVGKANNTGGGAYDNSKQWLLFDAYQPFKLVSFKVYANSLGKRHFVLVDRLGNLIKEKYLEIPAGLNTITVNWDVPAGMQHRITAFDDNSEVIRDLWRNNGGVSYPYAIGSLGAITGSTAGSTYYYYLYDWVVHTDGAVATGPRTMVTATVVNGVQVAPLAVLEGPFDVNTNLMRDDLRTAGLVPLVEPYTALGYASFGGGGETTSPTVLAVSGNNAVVDWVRVELRSAVDPAAMVAARQGLLQRDGDIVGTDGSSPLFFSAPGGNYYVAVRHRNHLGCMSAAPLALAGPTVTVDLSSSGIATWGSNARKNLNGKMVLFCGNTLSDAVLKYTGTGNDRDPILSAIGGSVPTAITTGYQTTDANLDGVVKYTGAANDRDPILVNIGGVVPTATRLEQLP